MDLSLKSAYGIDQPWNLDAAVMLRNARTMVRIINLILPGCRQQAAFDLSDFWQVQTPPRHALWGSVYVTGMLASMARLAAAQFF